MDIFGVYLASTPGEARSRDHASPRTWAVRLFIRLLPVPIASIYSVPGPLLSLYIGSLMNFASQASSFGLSFCFMNSRMICLGVVPGGYHYIHGFPHTTGFYSSLGSRWRLPNSPPGVCKLWFTATEKINNWSFIKPVYSWKNKRSKRNLESWVGRPRYGKGSSFNSVETKNQKCILLGLPGTIAFI